MQVEIFITDRDPRIRMILGQTLERIGYKYSPCECSNELIAALNKSDIPAIVFLDIYLDGSDGIPTIEKLRSVRRRFRLRFVAGGDIAVAIAANLIATANDIDVGRTLYKPIPLDQFITAVTDDVGLLMQ